VDAGGRLLCGGGRPPGLPHGCWFEPTLIADVPLSDAAVAEEAFGPVAVVIGVDGFEAALRIGNAVPHGLVATLYSENPESQRKFLEQAQAGILVLNRPLAPIDPAAPFNGWKASGFGLPEHGRWDFEAYTRTQAVYR
jgi:succinate-semialdehyde dehydrogenase/glutarate-semialdehyde dehydrogenase